MAEELHGFKVAVLAENGVEQVELTEPKKALEEAGAQVLVVSPQRGRIKAWDFTDWGRDIPVDVELDSARPEEFDALLLPGGVMNPDRLRMNPRAVEFTRSFIDGGKPVASICHGPWVLIEADAVRGCTLTSWPSLKTDIRNAGGNWVDREVVRDHELVTSRKPDDIPAFNRETIRMFADARRQPQTRTAG
jgi:protease I